MQLFIKEVNMNIYASVDKVSGKVHDYFLGETDEDAIRTSMYVFRNMYPLKDIDIVKVGKANMNNPAIESTEKVKISWAIYRLPETKAENFKAVGIDVDLGEKDNEEKEV